MGRNRAFLLSALAFFLALALGSTLVNFAEQSRRDKQRQVIKDIGIAQAHILENHLNQALSATFALAAILRQRGSIDNFASLSTEMINNYRGISNLQLAPNGVVTQIYPLGGNEAAIGHDLLNDPRRRVEAQAAIESRKLTLAGPFTLVQGGMGVIGRLPVFVLDDAGEERFWGFTIALIRLPGLLKASNLNRLVEQGYSYNISRFFPDGGAKFVFAWSDEEILKNAISVPVEVPNGRWILAIAPRGGWQPSSLLPLEIVLVLLVGTMISVVTYAFTRRREILYQEVELRTRELSGANRELEAQITQREQVELALRESEESLRILLETTNAIPWECDAKTWQFTYVGPQAASLLGYPIEQWHGKDFWPSHIHPEDRDYAIKTCHEYSKRYENYEFEYRMISSDGRNLWIHDIVSVEVEDGAVKTLRGFMIDITERKQAEEALRDLSGRLINAQEEERRRLARELHDDISQRLAVLGIEAGKLEQSPGSPQLAQERLAGMKEQIVNLSTDIHMMARQLHPSILDDLGLVDAIEAECTRFTEREGIDVKFTADIPIKLPIPKDVSLCLYRLTQEGLRNIAKHSQAQEARIILSTKEGSILLSIQDSGVGFDPSKVRGKAGLGLASMGERVKLIRGSLSVRSKPEKGTLIEVQVPLAGTQSDPLTTPRQVNFEGKTSNFTSRRSLLR